MSVHSKFMFMFFFHINCIHTYMYVDFFHIFHMATFIYFFKFSTEYICRLCYDVITYNVLTDLPYIFHHIKYTLSLSIDTSIYVWFQPHTLRYHGCLNVLDFVIIGPVLKSCSVDVIVIIVFQLLICILEVYIMNEWGWGNRCQPAIGWSSYVPFNFKNKESEIIALFLCSQYPHPWACQLHNGEFTINFN